MACEIEKNALVNAQNVLKNLWNELANASPSDKQRIRDEIEQQRNVVESLEDDYNRCRAQTQVTVEQIHIPSGQIQLSYSLFGEKSENENFNKIITFSGNGDIKEVILDSFEIVRDAKTYVTPYKGSFNKSTGEFYIPAHIKVTFGIITADQDLVLTTGYSESSPLKKYSGEGKVLDASSLEFTLVAAGELSAIPYFVKVIAKLEKMPS